MSSTIYTNTHYLCRHYVYTANSMDETEDYPLSIHSFPVFLDILVIQFINFFVYFLFSIISYSLSWLYYDGVHLFTFNYYFASSFKDIIIFLQDHHPFEAPTSGFSEDSSCSMCWYIFWLPVCSNIAFSIPIGFWWCTFSPF